MALQMRKRTFSFPDDLDLELRRKAVDLDMRFSDVVIAAVRMYLTQNKDVVKKGKEKR